MAMSHLSTEFLRERSCRWAAFVRDVLNGTDSPYGVACDPFALEECLGAHGDPAHRAVPAQDSILHVENAVAVSSMGCLHRVTPPRSRSSG